MEHPENSTEYAGLQVNSGVSQQPTVNPYLKRGRFQRRELSVAWWSKAYGAATSPSSRRP